jgi:predicted nucleotidyltransferase
MEKKTFQNEDEFSDLLKLMKTARENGAKSAGVFGSALSKERESDSDIDVFINSLEHPYLGEVDYQVGEKSGTLFHIFKKRPGIRNGNSRFEEIQNEAETKGKKLFGK